MSINLSTFTGKKILVTGYSGFLGSSLCDQLSNSKMLELRLLARKTNYLIPNPQSKKIVYINGDIKFKNTWRMALKDGVDYIFHLGASESNTLKTGNKKSSSNLESFETNFKSIANLVHECEKLKQKPKIIFASSANIAGLTNTPAINELTVDNLESLWSLHKLMAEQYLDFYKKKHSIPSVALRFTNVFGLTKNKMAFLNMTLNKIIHNAIYKNEISLYDNKNCQRDFLFIEDAVSSLIYSARDFDKLQGEKYYYIGTGEGKTFSEISDLINERVFTLLQKRCHIYHNKNLLELIEKRQCIIDASYFKKITGWKPTNKFTYNLNRTFDMVLQNS